MAGKRRALRSALIGWIGLGLGACAERSLPTAPVERTAAGRPAAAAAPAEVREPPLDCARALGRLAAGVGRDPSTAAGEPTGLLLLEEPGRAIPNLRLDLPVPTVRSADAAEAGCLLLLEAEAGPAERRVLTRERVWSERVAAVERRANPEYELARRELARLADRLDREDREQARDLKRLPATGDVLVDALGLLGGLVLGGIGSFARDREFEEARARLESIPRWIEETRFEPYEVTVAETELVRRATVRLALVEPSSGRFWATSLPFARVDRLRVASDLHPRDRNRLEGDGRFVGPAELEALAATPPPLALSELLPRLSALVTGEPGRPGGPAEVRLAWAGADTPRLAAASAADASARAAGGGAAPPAGPAGDPSAGPAGRAALAAVLRADPAPTIARPGPRPSGEAAARPGGSGPSATAVAKRDRTAASSDAVAAAGVTGQLAAADPGVPRGGEVAAGRDARTADERAALEPPGPTGAIGDWALEVRSGPSAPAPVAGRLRSADRADRPPGSNTLGGGRALPAGDAGGAGSSMPERRVGRPFGVAPARLGPDGPPGESGAVASARDPVESAFGPAPRVRAPGTAVEPAAGSRSSPEAALVRIEGPGGTAHGFYVGRDKVLTLRRVLGGSSLARVETADGFTTWGVVEGERSDSELLLLHVPRPGRPLATAGPGTAAAPEGPMPEPGMPVLVEGRVVAVSLDPLAGRLAGPAELARILAELGKR